MRKYSKIAVVLVVLGLISVSCSEKEVFRVDISKSFKAEVQRSMALKTVIKISAPDKNGEMQENEIITENNLNIVAESSEELKDSSKPGVYNSKEKLVSAVFFISQEQKGESGKSVKMEYRNGEIKILEKNVPEKMPMKRPTFEESSRHALKTMVDSSGMVAEIKIGDRGEILDMSGDGATEKGFKESMQNYSGAKGIVFPEKAVKVGDTWVEKKKVSDVAGFQIDGDPIDLELKFSREKDETINGKKLAVFKVDYHLDRKGVKGKYGGFPVTVNLKDIKDVKIYFDRKRKTFVKTVTDSKILLLSDPDAVTKPQQQFKIDINVENTIHSEITEKVK